VVIIREVRPQPSYHTINFAMLCPKMLTAGTEL